VCRGTPRPRSPDPHVADGVSAPAAVGWSAASPRRCCRGGGRRRARGRARGSASAAPGARVAGSAAPTGWRGGRRRPGRRVAGRSAPSASVRCGGRVLSAPVSARFVGVLIAAVSTPSRPARRPGRRLTPLRLHATPPSASRNALLVPRRRGRRRRRVSPDRQLAGRAHRFRPSRFGLPEGVDPIAQRHPSAPRSGRGPAVGVCLAASDWSAGLSAC
jgi:hypothetical protein